MAVRLTAGKNEWDPGYRSAPEKPKWDQPGWRIEKEFKPRVLIGNWYEDRLQFYLDKTRPRPSTYQVDFKQYGGCFPDCVLRREQRVRDEGLDKRFFLYHHNGYKNELISWYDEHYNQRERPSCQRFPVLRSWNGHKLGWRPEKNDHPIQGQPTRFGLLEKKQEQWQKTSDGTWLNNYGTSYTTSYLNPPPEARVQLRYANLRETSTKVNPVNLVHKNYVSRHNKFIQTPEFLKPPPGQAEAPPGRGTISRHDLVQHLRDQETKKEQPL
ncbi:hypothetical protein LSAT2_024097 [Lamellibrachia satsuma]|nr:hypothetical protein LSAT2_024097 [Lamellibrachia satsuma]